MVVGTKQARADARERRCQRQPSVATLLSNTELQREFPLHVVCSWLSNSPRIAQQSYLLVTEDNFAKAAGRGEGDGKGGIPREKAPRFLNNLAWTLQICTVQSNSRSIY